MSQEEVNVLDFCKTCLQGFVREQGIKDAGEDPVNCQICVIQDDGKPLFYEEANVKQKQKQLHKENPPRSIVLIIPHPIGNDDLKKISDYLYSEYHFDTPPEHGYEGYGHLFYNADLRSIMGDVMEWDEDTITCNINASTYVEGGGCWQEYWEKLLEASEITEWG